MKKFGLIIILGLLCISFTGCSLFSEHKHTVVVDEGAAATCTKGGFTSGTHCSVCGEILSQREAIPAKGHTVVVDEGVAATCTVDGFTAGTHCSECGEILSQREPISAKGHSYGEWIKDGEQSYRECSTCSYREVKVIGDNGAQTLHGYYGNFDLFLRDCNASGNKLVYQGSQNRIEVNLRAGSKKCDGQTIVFPERVVSVSFIGESKGNPYQNVRIEIDTRSSDINISFKNVKIESSDTILVSKTRNINVNIAMSGVCSFLITSTGANGEDRAPMIGNSPPERGGDGEDGKDAMVINGNCVIACAQGTFLEIRGGNGGNGGKGGAAGDFNGAGTGSGGNGGRGGYAVMGESLVKVTAYQDCTISLIGGQGGQAGKQGDGNFWTNLNGNHGKDGEPGADGNSGCEIVYSD